MLERHQGPGDRRPSDTALRAPSAGQPPSSGTCLQCPRSPSFLPHLGAHWSLASTHGWILVFTVWRNHYRIPMPGCSRRPKRSPVPSSAQPHSPPASAAGGHPCTGRSMVGLFWTVPLTWPRGWLFPLSTGHPPGSVRPASVRAWLAPVLFILCSAGGHWGAFHALAIGVRQLCTRVPTCLCKQVSRCPGNSAARHC